MTSAAKRIVSTRYIAAANREIIRWPLTTPVHSRQARLLYPVSGNGTIFYCGKGFQTSWKLENAFLKEKRRGENMRDWQLEFFTGIGPPLDSGDRFPARQLAGGEFLNFAKTARRIYARAARRPATRPKISAMPTNVPDMYPAP